MWSAALGAPDYCGQMVLSVCACVKVCVRCGGALGSAVGLLVVFRCDWFGGWMWLGRRLDRLFLSLSSEVVSSGPFSMGAGGAVVWFVVVDTGGVGGGRGPGSRRIWLLSGDWGVLSSFEASRPFWYCERVTWERKKVINQTYICYCSFLFCEIN